MPNYVSNLVHVEGSRRVLSEFLADVTKESSQRPEGKFSFENIIEPPLDDDYERSYLGWNVDHWDTKWDAVDAFYEDKGDHIEIEFQTAWSIPVKIWQALAEQYPSLSFTFDSLEEQGWGKIYSADYGVLTLDREWGIPETHEEYLALDLECRMCADEECSSNDGR